MKRASRLQAITAGVFFAGTLALGTTAQAVTLDAGIFAVGNGDAANPIVITVTNPGQPTGGGLFTDTINFDLGPFTHFNMETISTVNISFFASTIFENLNDGEIPLANGYNGAADTFTALPLSDLGLSRDYHLHPGGIEFPNASYTLRLWGSNPAPIPVPAAVYLFGSGLIGLVGLARRKMSA